jgi:hypothetical protein
MDANQYISGGVGASIVIALLVLKQIYNTINHKRVRSNCCGRNLEASVDFEDTTPKDVVVHQIEPSVESKQRGDL